MLNFRAKNVAVVVIATADSNITFEFCGATIPLKIDNACDLHHCLQSCKVRLIHDFQTMYMYSKFLKD